MGHPPHAAPGGRRPPWAEQADFDDFRVFAFLLHRGEPATELPHGRFVELGWLQADAEAPGGWRITPKGAAVLRG